MTNNIDIQNTSVTINGNNYHYISQKEENGAKLIFWMYGKINFISKFKKKLNSWQLNEVFLQKNNNLFKFKNVVGHGIMNEEICFSNDIDDLYIELPHNFQNIMIAVSEKFLDLNQ